MRRLLIGSSFFILTIVAAICVRTHAGAQVLPAPAAPEANRAVNPFRVPTGRLPQATLITGDAAQAQRRSTLVSWGFNPDDPQLLAKLGPYITQRRAANLRQHPFSRTPALPAFAAALQTPKIDTQAMLQRRLTQYAKPLVPISTAALTIARLNGLQIGIFNGGARIAPPAPSVTALYVNGNPRSLTGNLSLNWGDVVELLGSNLSLAGATPTFGITNVPEQFAPVSNDRYNCGPVNFAIQATSPNGDYVIATVPDAPSITGTISGTLSFSNGKAAPWTTAVTYNGGTQTLMALWTAISDDPVDPPQSVPPLWSHELFSNSQYWQDPGTVYAETGNTRNNWYGGPLANGGSGTDTFNFPGVKPGWSAIASIDEVLDTIGGADIENFSATVAGAGYQQSNQTTWCTGYCVDFETSGGPWVYAYLSLYGSGPVGLEASYIPIKVDWMYQGGHGVAYDIEVMVTGPTGTSWQADGTPTGACGL